MTNHNFETSLVPWKLYITLSVQSVLAFYLATFSVAVFIAKGGLESIMSCIVIFLLYLSVITICIIRLVQKLPVATLMILVPIAPLAALIIVLSLIPILKLL